MDQMSASDYSLFQEFLRYKAQRPAYLSVPAALRINVEASWASVMRMPGPANATTNVPAWLLVKEAWETTPEAFTLTSDIHSDAIGTYFSMRWTRPSGHFFTFHAYGKVVGTKFLIERITMAMKQHVMEVFLFRPSPPSSIASGPHDV